MTEDELFLTSILKCRRVDLFTEIHNLTSAQEQELEQMRIRRQNGEPIQYILGTCDFMGFELAVDRGVLIPRPETELMVDHAIKEFAQYDPNRVLRILDLGTGSGNIAIALASKIENCYVTTLDISQEAIRLARQNAARHHVDHKIDFVQYDLITFLFESHFRATKYDLIISNPPYIPTMDIRRLPKDVQHEPRIALDGGRDGYLFIKHIISKGCNCMVEGAKLLMEIGDGQEEEIKKIVSGFPQYSDVGYYKDYTQTIRFVELIKRKSNGL